MTDPSIFKAYDIRGTYPEQIDEQLAYRIGRAFARVLSDLQDTPVEELTVGLGRDMRLSAPSMAAEYARGITDEGANVVDIGMVGTEQLYWTVGARELDGGLMCTASHNPPAYTGAKLVKRGALALSGDSGIGEVRDIVMAGEPGPPAEQPGEITREDVGDDVPQGRAEVHRPGQDRRSCRWCSTAATAWPGRWSGRCSTSSRSSRCAPTSSPTASSRTTDPTR